jgi:hypothetical protein
MQRLSLNAAFRDKVLQTTRSIPKVGEWLSPELVKRLRSAILGRDWQRVDHFPALTIDLLNHTVDVTTKVAGKASKPLPVSGLVDLGAYSPDKSLTIDLDQPAQHPTYAEDPETALTHPAENVTMGDGPDPALAPMHAQSKRLAEVLNRLSLNTTHSPQLTVRLEGRTLTDPGTLIQVLQATGHQVLVDDDLYFANFGHLHDGARDVLMPFWIDSQIAVPGAHRSLLLPVSHSEHELHVRGPIINADVSYYFGIDGRSEFRTMDSLNQPWVLGRKAFLYTGDRAAEAINLLAQATRVYLAVHLAHPALPFGGYYTLGVCQDVNAAVEQQLQGRVILFPLTRDRRYFPLHGAQLHLDPRDDQFLHLLAQAPDDRGSGRPPFDRVLGALPTTDLAALVIPGLREDVSRVEQARSRGVLRRTYPLVSGLSVLSFAVVIAALAWWVRRRRSSRPHRVV